MLLQTQCVLASLTELYMAVDLSGSYCFVFYLFIYFFAFRPHPLLYKERETEEKKEIVARLKTPCTADPFLTPAIMHEAEGGVKVL